MKISKYILSLLFLSQSVLANPTIFGLTIGETTIQDMKKQYNVSHSGTNMYTNGDMYTISPSQIKFDGLNKVITIYNKSGKLVAVLTEFPKNKFEYLNSALSNKYSLVSKQIPFVGDKSATYKDGETEISLNAPHLSFGMTMNYIHNDLLRAFNEQTEKEKKQKQQQENSML
ncbi:hypothetical protein [Vibrio furnissii]|uniref:hypothetical protein n=1 Tax=Vibrio furnissii TaxID=29494 RepID=UPI00257403C0|nr:hypothetical protein [Vibrio furnissii]WJG24394.1 hypothetical protein QSU95_18110 [Vibrio furnissii]